MFNPINCRPAAQELAFILKGGSINALVSKTGGADVVQRAKALATHVLHVSHWLYASEGEPHAAAIAQLPALAALGGSAIECLVAGCRQRGQPLHPDARQRWHQSRPKGVLHTRRSGLAYNAAMRQVVQYRREVGACLWRRSTTRPNYTPASFLLKPQVGVTQVLQRKFDAADALQLVKEEKTSFFFAAPTMVAMMLHSPELAWRSLQSLRLVEYGSANLPPHLTCKWSAKVGSGLVRAFGATGMGPCMAVLYPHEQFSHEGSAGLPLLNMAWSLPACAKAGPVT